MKKSSALLVALILVAISGQVFAQAATNEATAPGMVLDDPYRGIKFTAPNALWSVNGSSYSIGLSHGTYYDASVYLRKSYYTVTTAQEAYNQRKDSLKSYLPGAQYLKENESITIGNITGVSMTYKNPSDLKIIREIVFLHKGVPYELEFKAKEENFEKVKADFATILAKLSLY